MSHDSYPCHVFGVLISKHLPDLLPQMTEGDLEKLDGEPASCHDEDFEERMLFHFGDRIIKELAVKGIEAPRSAGLFWTGGDDDRGDLGEDTPLNDWIFGFGLLTNPNLYQATPSFLTVARWHGWVLFG